MSEKNKKKDDIINDIMNDIGDFNSSNIDNLDISEEDVTKQKDEILADINKKIDELKKDVEKNGIDDYSLKNKIFLLEKGKLMLDELMVNILTTMPQNARAYEVLAKMLQTISEMNYRLIEDNENNMSDNDETTTETSVTGKINDIVDAIAKKNLSRIKNGEIKVVGEE